MVCNNEEDQEKIRKTRRNPEYEIGVQGVVLILMVIHLGPL